VPVYILLSDRHVAAATDAASEQLAAGQAIDSLGRATPETTGFLFMASRADFLYRHVEEWHLQQVDRLTWGAGLRRHTNKSVQPDPSPRDRRDAHTA
jgi:hypothetical protein